MKIIGNSASGFLIEIHKDELANLQGFHSAYSEGFKCTIGASVPMSEIYADARIILDTHREAADAAKRLRSAGEKFASYFKTEEPKKK